MPEQQNFDSRRAATPAAHNPTQSRPDADSPLSGSGRPFVGVCGICKNVFNGPLDCELAIVWAGVEETVEPRCCPHCAIAMSGRVERAVRRRSAREAFAHAQAQSRVPCLSCGHHRDEHFEGWGTCFHVGGLDLNGLMRVCKCTGFVENSALLTP